MILCVCLGTTPKRKEYVYPRTLLTLKDRTELEDEFRAQQQQLMSVLGQCEVVTEGEEEDKPEDQVQLSLLYTMHGNKIHILGMFCMKYECIDC